MRRRPFVRLPVALETWQMLRCAAPMPLESRLLAAEPQRIPVSCSTLSRVHRWWVERTCASVGSQLSAMAADFAMCSRTSARCSAAWYCLSLAHCA